MPGGEAYVTGVTGGPVARPTLLAFMRLSRLPTGLTAGAAAAAGLAGGADASPEPEPTPQGALELLLDAPGHTGPARHPLPGRAMPRERARPRRASTRAAFPVRGRAGYGEAIARFGVQRPGHAHQGQDVFAPAGTPLVAVRDAVVVEAGGGDGRGNYTALYSPRDRRTYVYFHMQAPASVKPGERVRAGERIGRVGCTGSCFGDHLHFEVRRGRGSDGQALDPLPLLRRWRNSSATPA
jgi:murein DD-endopeptidase MepM/ murein hydrolase activator NlpD